MLLSPVVEVHRVVVVSQIRIGWFLEASGVVSLAGVHKREVVKDPLVLHRLFLKNLQHLYCCFPTEGVAILAFSDFFVLFTVKGVKVIVIYVLDVKPLYLEIVSELVAEVVPPVRK